MVYAGVRVFRLRWGIDSRHYASTLCIRGGGQDRENSHHGASGFLGRSRYIQAELTVAELCIKAYKALPVGKHYLKV